MQEEGNQKFKVIFSQLHTEFKASLGYMSMYVYVCMYLYIFGQLSTEKVIVTPVYGVKMKNRTRFH